MRYSKWQKELERDLIIMNKLVVIENRMSRGKVETGLAWPSISTSLSQLQMVIDVAGIDQFKGKICESAFWLFG